MEEIKEEAPPEEIAEESGQPSSEETGAQSPLKEKLKIYLNRYGHLLWIAGLVFIFLTVCSTCSFIYPMNEWVDSNVYFTIGKAMLGGKVLYRDIFDQKGPYLFMAHSFAYLLSHRSFIGVYLIELVLAFVFAYAEYRILLLYIEKKYALLSLPVVMFASYATYAFVYGDSAEEFSLPFMALSLFFLLEFTKGKKMSLVKYGLVGAFTSYTLWIKFTLCGFYFAWALLMLIFELKDKNYKHLLLGIAVFFGAFFTVCVPVFIYFGVNHSFGDLFEAYFYRNIFVYTSGTDGQNTGFARKLFWPIWMFIRSIGYGYTFYILIIPGFLFLALSKEFTRREKAAIFTAYAVMNFIIFVGGRGGKYYGLPVNIFSFIGIIAICKVKFTAKMWDFLFKKFFIVAGVCTFSLAGLSIAINPIRYMVFSKKSSRVQYQFAELIEEYPSANIIDYGALDLGVHTATDTFPECKYYFKPNMALPAVMETQDEWVREGKADYVVSTARLPEEISGKYELIARGRQRADSIIEDYYLYRLKTLTQEGN